MTGEYSQRYGKATTKPHESQRAHDRPLEIVPESVLHHRILKPQQVVERDENEHKNWEYNPQRHSVSESGTNSPKCSEDSLASFLPNK